MPLYIVERDDHRQITTDDLAKLMSIDNKVLKTLQKNPVFEINPIKTRPDKLNGGVIAPAGKASKPVIYVNLDKNGVITDKPGGLRKTIRYATAIVPDKENERISTYEPKRVFFMDQLDIEPSFELALFKYCLPACKNSPVADKRNWHYSLQDKGAKAEETTDMAAKLTKALAYLSNSPDNGGLTDNSIVLIAKGLYAQNRTPAIIPNPSARNKSIIEIKADLINLAIKEPGIFLDCVNDDVNSFYGMILDAVDRNIFAIRKTGHSKSWFWEKGPHTNSMIVEIGNGVNDFDALKSAIEANPNFYYQNLGRAIAEVSGKENMQAFFKQQKLEKVEGDENEQEEEITGRPPVFTVPDNYDDAIKLAISFNNGKRPSPAILGAFWKLIKDGKVNVENVKETITNLVTGED